MVALSKERIGRDTRPALGPRARVGIREGKGWLNHPKWKEAGRTGGLRNRRFLSSALAWARGERGRGQRARAASQHGQLGRAGRGQAARAAFHQQSEMPKGETTQATRIPPPNCFTAFTKCWAVLEGQM